MLDLVCVFSTCGLLLWRRRLSPDGDGVLVEFIHEVLLADQAGQDRFDRGNFSIKWTLANTQNLVFVAVYLNIANLYYVDALLESMKKKFTDMYTNCNFRTSQSKQFIAFDPVYDKMLTKFENGPNKHMKPANVVPSRPQSKSAPGPAVSSADAVTQNSSEKDEDEEEDDGVLSATGALERLKVRAGSRRGRGGSSTGKPKSSAAKPAKSSAPTKKTTKRNWNNIGSKASDAKDLDHTAINNESGQSEINVAARVVIPAGDDSGYDTSDVEIEESAKSGIFGYFQGLIGKELEREDIMPALNSVRDNLMAKNVAASIADDICESVCATLVGKNLSSLQIRSAVRTSMEATLTRILAISHDTDILRRVAHVKATEHRPFSVVFVGVNGVGKSTSLSKICYYFLSKGLSVSMVACDTFRAGAVEQLKTHANALGVELFQKGYNRDPSSVAMDGIENALRKQHDVVLIDTAGRMQDNEPLMRALSKLIVQNRPDLVLFVGEALVGNDGVDQLTKFNLSLSDLSTDANPRLIDGIVLTKFDTIDDKVGAAISMTYTAKIPIMFVGMGQDYGDMRRMNVKSVIKKLLK